MVMFTKIRPRVRELQIKVVIDHSGVLERTEYYIIEIIIN